MSIKGPAYDNDFQRWSAPFIMEAINARVVLRSNMLLGMAYGDDFLYREQMMTGKGFKGRLSAIGLTAGLGLFAVSCDNKSVTCIYAALCSTKTWRRTKSRSTISGAF